MSQPASRAVHEECAAALLSANVQAFLRLIREGETHQGPDAYAWIVGSTRARPIMADTLADHPRRRVFVPSLKVWSTAAGAYQFLQGTWDECQRALGLPDFSPASQDLAAVFLIHRRGALADVVAGRIEQAIGKCAREWASLPGSPYGQPVQTLERALAAYATWGGQINAPATSEKNEAAATTPLPPEKKTPTAAPAQPTEEDLQSGRAFTTPTQEAQPMAPFIAAGLSALIQNAPALIRVFGDSPQAEKNAKAAETVAAIAMQATGQPTVEGAVRAIEADPAKATAYRQAVEARWMELTESGGGGIEGARKADAAASAAGGILHSPSFWVAVLLLPLVYLLVLSLIGLVGTATWSDDVRAGLAGSLISAVIGGLVGYYYGQTTSRNRSPQ